MRYNETWKLDLKTATDEEGGKPLPIIQCHMKQSKTKATGIERLARQITIMNQTALSGHALHAARLCLLDTLGVGIYGSSQPETEQLLQSLRRFGTGKVSVWGRRETLDAESAALICGSLCHLRELDDVHYAILHTGCVCVPAAIATAELEHSSLGQLLRAIVNGVEVMSRISLGMDYMDHRERGWHGTATCGAFGAAAAAGYLLGLTEDQLADALGTAGSRTGGTWAFSVDGAMSKRLHPGLAARDGLLAAYLAQAGVPGPHYVLEAEDGGFYRLFSREWDIERVLRNSERLEIEQVEYKWFASCKSVHSPITAALQIYRENPQRTPEEVSSILVEVNRSALAMAGHSYEPDSVVSAQISIPYGVALGLLGRPGQGADYALDRLGDPMVRTLADRVKVGESQEFNLLRQTEHLSGTRVTVEWNDGTRSVAVVKFAKGSIGDPLTEEDVIQKYCGLTEGVLGRERSQKLMELILHGDTSIPVAQLVKLMVQPL